jgi:hypothetical protein
MIFYGHSRPRGRVRLSQPQERNHGAQRDFAATLIASTLRRAACAGPEKRKPAVRISRRPGEGLLPSGDVTYLDSKQGQLRRGPHRAAVLMVR